MTEKDQVSGKQGLRGLIENGEIVVAMRGRPSLQKEPAATEIKLKRSVNQQCRRHDPDLVDQAVTHDPAKGFKIERAARAQGFRQILVPNEHDSFSSKSSVTERVVGMTVRVNDVTDRSVGPSPDGCEKPSSFKHAAAGIDDGNGIGADDKTDIGDRTFIFACHQRDGSDVDENAGRDFGHVQRERLRSHGRRNGERGKQSQQREAETHPLLFHNTVHGSVASQQALRISRADYPVARPNRAA